MKAYTDVYIHVPYIASHTPTQASRTGPTMLQLLATTSQYIIPLFKSILSHRGEIIQVNAILHITLECIAIYCHIAICGWILVTDINFHMGI